MGTITFDLLHGEILPGRGFREWIPSWWYRSEGISTVIGEVQGNYRWLLAGWFINDHNTHDVVNKFAANHDVEYLYKIDGQFILLYNSILEDSLEIYRDRVGTFPIVYAKHEGVTAISIDIGELRQIIEVTPSPSTAFFEQWPLYRKTFPPFTPYHGIHGLAPEHSLIIKGNSIIENNHPMIFPDEVEFPDMSTSSRILGGVLSQSVEKRIDCSKRMGIFLSGGTDSSLVVALVRKYYPGNLRTLFVTFEDNERDYREYARKVADQYSTNHSTVEMSPVDYVRDWAETVKVLQAPIPMPCHIGIYHALRMLNGEVDLMIDGDGADTVFGSSIWPQMIFLSRIGNWIPGLLKKGIDKFSELLPDESLLKRIVNMCLTAVKNPLHTYPHVNAAMISEDDFTKLFLRGEWQQAVNYRKSFAAGDFYKGFFSYLMLHGIPEDIATSVRLGLSQSIFFTYPFLDYELLQASMRMPNRHRYHYRIRKAPLKRYALDYFDEDFVYKPKEGFGVPLSKWFMKKELEPFLMLPLEDRSIKRGWWREDELKRIIDIHKAGRGNDNTAEAIPWIIINMELWARICIEGEPPALYQ